MEMHAIYSGLYFVELTKNAQTKNPQTKSKIKSKQKGFLRYFKG